MSTLFLMYVKRDPGKFEVFIVEMHPWYRHVQFTVLAIPLSDIFLSIQVNGPLDEHLHRVTPAQAAFGPSSSATDWAWRHFLPFVWAWKLPPASCSGTQLCLDERRQAFVYTLSSDVHLHLPNWQANSWEFLSFIVSRPNSPSIL